VVNVAYKDTHSNMWYVATFDK